MPCSPYSLIIFILDLLFAFSFFLGTQLTPVEEIIRYVLCFLLLVLTRIPVDERCNWTSIGQLESLCTIIERLLHTHRQSDRSARRSLSWDFPPAVHHGHTSSPRLPLHLPTHRNPLPNHGIRPRPRRRLPLRQRTETSIIIIRQQAPPRRLQACPVRGRQIQNWERRPPCRSRIIRRQQAATIERSALENMQEGL